MSKKDMMNSVITIVIGIRLETIRPVRRPKNISITAATMPIA